MKSGKIKLLFLISTLVLVMIVGTTAVFAQDEDRTPGSGAIWTTDGSCGDLSQDVNHFARGHHVHINGSNFDPGEYEWAITGNPGGSSADPGIAVASGTYTVGSSGAFCFDAYTVANDDGGEYTVDFGRKNDNYRVEPGEATVSIGVAGCAWTPTGGSIRAVNLTINNAILTINGVGVFSSSQTINLPAGVYTYEWEAVNKFFEEVGETSGSFIVEECPPASVTVVPQTCSWDELEGSSTDVVLTISNAILTIDGVGTFTSSLTINLTPGTYNYSWIANPGYSGSGSGSFTLLECEPGKADAAVDVGGCTWDAQNGSQINVTLTLENAILTIDGQDYSTSQTIKLSPGTYPYTWVAAPSYTGSGSGSITIYGCEPASVSVEVGACEWNGELSMTPVYITVNGATLKIYEGATLVHTYGPGSYTIDLSEGSYTYTWTANENYTGSGSGSFSTVNCEPGKSDAAVEIGACVYADGQSWTTVVITVSNARLTIDGKEYIENAELKFLPGDYPYSWVAINDDFQGSGEGVLTVGACKPKEEQPDVAAGGLGPSFIATAAPAILTISGLGLAWVLIKNRTKKTN
ncbi:hypothetical protein JR338_03805 [Chloroflexota bacterium]|nr:hypothetical protein JR338_03805 [Chloroflexota bacterium]